VQDDVLIEAQRMLGHTFRDPDLLRVALTHASSADDRFASNERMEFLGDAVLGMIVCEYLFRSYTDLLEGEMTKIKSAVVSRRLCARLTEQLGLDRLLTLGKGMKTRGAIPPSLSAAALESAIGALFLDAGLDRVREFLMPLIAPHIDEAYRNGHQQNFKSVLQQHAQTELDAEVDYVMLDEKGPDHAKCFQVCADVGGRRFPGCWAPSKKQAEQQAALVALEELGLISRDGGAVVIKATPPASGGSGGSSNGPVTTP
jgi:ribonuclease-3